MKDISAEIDSKAENGEESDPMAQSLTGEKQGIGNHHSVSGRSEGERSDLEQTVSDDQPLYLQIHKDILDGTGMYPLKTKPCVKRVLQKLLFPSGMVYLLVFGLTFLLFKNRPLGEAEFTRLTGGCAFLLTAILAMVLFQKKYGFPNPGLWGKYEGGRRLWIGFCLSLAGAWGVLYFFVLTWKILPLWAGHFLVFLGLMAGNILLLWLSYELASYIIFGFLTFLVSQLTFNLFYTLLAEHSPLGQYSWTWLLAQTISFLFAVLFAFFTNRQFVFTQKGKFWADFAKFFNSRILTTLVWEFGGMTVMIQFLHMDPKIAKFIGSILVTVANYFISKFFIFTDPSRKDGAVKKKED